MPLLKRRGEAFKVLSLTYLVNKLQKIKINCIIIYLPSVALTDALVLYKI